MRRQFTFEQLKSRVIGRYYSDKTLSLFRKNSHEINQLNALCRRFSTGREVSSQWPGCDVCDESWASCRCWLSENCYAEVVKLLSDEERIDQGERRLLDRFDGGYYSQHTLRALEPFVRVVRGVIGLRASVNQSALQTEPRLQSSTSLFNQSEGIDSKVVKNIIHSQLSHSRATLRNLNSLECQLTAVTTRLRVLTQRLGIIDEDCPITTDAISNRVELSGCHHAFEKEAIEQWYARSMVEHGQAACPCCRGQFTFDQIEDKPLGVDNLLTQLESWSDNQPSSHDSEVPLLSDNVLSMTA